MHFALHALTVAAVIALDSGLVAQIFTENAGPASPELPAIREAVNIRETRNVREWRLDSQFIWSPTPALETRTTVPYLFRDYGGTDADGLGDLALRLKHSLWQEDDVLESTRFAGLYELTLPTGDTDAARDAGGVVLPQRLQLGAGAAGIGGGLALTLIRDRHRFSAEGFYRHTLEDDGFELGDLVRGNLAYWYRLTPATFRSGPEGRDPLEVRGVIELLGSYRFESEDAGQGLSDQGTEVWLCPGVQVFGSGRFLFEGALQFPVHQNVDDGFGRREWGALVSWKVIF
jgi:hypothetical protein